MLNTKCIFKCFMIHCQIILPTCICTTINKYQWPKMSSCQFYTSIATAGHSSSTSWDQKFPQVSPVYPWVYRYDVSGHKSKGTQPLKIIIVHRAMLFGMGLGVWDTNKVLDSSCSYWRVRQTSQHWVEVQPKWRSRTKDPLGSVQVGFSLIAKAKSCC